MFIFLVTITSIIFLGLILVAGAKPTRSRLSEYELNRRSDKHNKQAKDKLARENAIDDIEDIIRVKVAILLVVFSILSIVLLGWAIGVVVAILGAFLYGQIARLKPIRVVSQKLYSKMESTILRTIYKFPKTIKLLRSVSHGASKLDKRLGSREELSYLVDKSGDILTEEEKKLITSGLSFNDTKVSSVMTSRNVISSIKKSEFLGPLTLDELHKTGHSRLPVIDKDIDHVVGILHLRSLLALDIKRSSTAEKAMESAVYYIREDQNLGHALAAFLHTHHHLFIVVNEYRETVGLLTLEDVIESLIGRKIIDEFDTHDDLRVVALRNPSGNNEPKDGHDI